jgi:hypothetical protein
LGNSHEKSKGSPRPFPAYIPPCKREVFPRGFSQGGTPNWGFTGERVKIKLQGHSYGKGGGLKGFSLYKIMNFIRQGVGPTPLGKPPWEGSGKKGAI